MNEDMNDRLSRYLDRLEGSIDTVIEFGSDQAPLVVNEFLAWEFWSHLAGTLFVSCIAVVFLVNTYHLYRKLVNIGDHPNTVSEQVNTELKLGISGLILLVCLLILPVPLFKTIKVIIAPRLVVLEKVAELAGKE